ncbi:sigma 54-interacting transcriptional regulator [Tundrisphaera sp. TA3]|uniref:sigma 54-interacting transcriptional regulator n=1 Tax=Tundrisphaera sp. TA3 TaxID=3435775 RepID=UPI003EBB15B3
MSESYALIYCKDARLAGDIAGAIDSIDLLRSVSIGHLDDSLSHAGRGDFRLLIAEISDETDIARLKDVVRRITNTSPSASTLLVGSEDREEMAREVMQAGAAEFVPHPGPTSFLASRAASLARMPIGPITTAAIRFRDQAEIMSPAGARVVDQIRRVAPIDATVLLAGELGSGKSRAARLIHEASHRCGRPFVTLNCKALSPAATEVEMLGQVRSAAMGTDRVQVGKFAEVQDGTILIDDIDSLSPGLQGKLLHAIESGIFEPLGSNDPVPMRARVIATSSRPLDLEVAAGRFRSDLYYRINVIEIMLPPLRQRIEEIPGLTARFVIEFAERCGREVEGIAPDALEALLRHDWPGNVRELRNILERAVVLGLTPTILLEDLRLKSPPASRSHPNHAGSPGPATLADAKRDAEQSRIVEALRKHGNVRLYAARELGISRMTLYKKMYEYGLMERPARDQGGSKSDGDAA